ncbi:MAG: hypothetical protein KF745_08860 [Phycisphaeraceae bacterium]|nr:hypothetical protein [Phycisphaeraceae bacterium]
MTSQPMLEPVDTDLGPPPATPDALHEWLEVHAGVSVPRRALLAASDAPFDYLLHTYFEGRTFPSESGPSDADGASHLTEPAPARGPADCVVWASRGGGKTFLGAVATMLDLVHKPSIQVRILAGSVEQAQRMHTHLRALFERPALARLVEGKLTSRRIALTNGSCAEVMASSQASVRGTRVQKVRCDEVDLFDRDVWTAAQLTTMSKAIPGPWGRRVRGSVEALSTMHIPMGLMWHVVADAARAGDTPHRQRRLLRWGVVDVLEHCGDEHRCESCPLFEECGGAAKPGRGVGRGSGHLPVHDAIVMKSRVSRETWEAEMLCLRPCRSGCVYEEFDPEAHTYDDGAPAPGPVESATTIVAGMDFGFRAPTVVLLGAVDQAGVLRIFDEHIAAGLTLDRHIDLLRGGRWPRIDWIGADPAGNQTNDQTGVSNVSLLRRAGLRIRARRSGLHEGLLLVKARLRPALGPARLLVHRRCTGLIESLAKYHYPPDRPEATAPEKDGSDHAADALRYLVLNLDAPFRTTVRSYL